MAVLETAPTAAIVIAMVDADDDALLDLVRPYPRHSDPARYEFEPAVILARFGETRDDLATLAG